MLTRWSTSKGFDAVQCQHLHTTMDQESDGVHAVIVIRCLDCGEELGRETYRPGLIG